MVAQSLTGADRRATGVPLVHHGRMRPSIVVAPATAPFLFSSVERLWDDGVALVSVELEPRCEWTLADREVLREELIAIGRESLARRLRVGWVGFECRARVDTGDVRSLEGVGDWFRRVGAEVGAAVEAGLAEAARRTPLDGPSPLVRVHRPLNVLLGAALALSVLVFAVALVCEEVAPAPEKVVMPAYMRSRPADDAAFRRAMRASEPPPRCGCHRGVCICCFPAPD